VTKYHIHNAFVTVGKIEDIWLPLRIDGALKGFSCVEFEVDGAVEAALALQKMQTSGREVWACRSKPPKPKSPAGDASTKSANTAGQGLSPSARSGGKGPTAGKRYAFKPAFRTRLTCPQTSLARGAGTGCRYKARRS
jgi:RNA recognition motif. (a.k.a. RRM, RBD, or RNP domain)